MKHVIALLSLLAVVGACAPPTDGMLEVLAAAPDVTAQAGTARTSMDVTMEFTGGVEMRTRVRGEGLVDMGRQVGSMSVKTQRVQRGQTSTQSMQLLYDGVSEYIRAPKGLPGLEAPTEWVRIDAAAGGGMNAFGLGPPTDSLALLRGVSGGVEEVGSEMIGETPTTHYRATIDLRKAVEQAPEANREVIESRLEGIDAEKMPVDVWLDEEGRVRRQSSSFDDGQGGFQVALDMTFDIYDFGVPVEVEFPDPAEVTDMPAPGPAPAP